MSTAAADTSPRPAAELAGLLEVDFASSELLEQALTHRSYAFEHGGLRQNERLEFLGDAVLAVVVTDEIYHAHPAAEEGRLAKVRAAAVKTGSLAAVARGIGLGGFVRLGRGEAASGGADKDSILADTLEAVIGAVYLHHGFEVVGALVRRLFGARLEMLAGRGAALDFKTSLQELAAERFGELPTYRVSDVGPDHQKVFSATVEVRGRKLGTGTGRNKKESEQRAAKQAYQHLADTARHDT